MNRHWISYITGAVLTLFWKYAKYCYNSDRTKKTMWQVTQEFCFEGSAENASSWFATVGVVWVIGGIYIDHIDFYFGELRTVPLHASIAFLLGCVAEMAAPEVVKRLVAWIISMAEKLKK